MTQRRQPRREKGGLSVSFQVASEMSLNMGLFAVKLLIVGMSQNNQRHGDYFVCHRLYNAWPEGNDSRGGDACP